MPDYKNEVIKVQTDNGDIVLSNQIVRETLAIGNNITDSEIYNFMMLCKYRNLNPFLKEAYIVKFNDTAQILVGKDAMIKRLHNNPACEGWEAGIIAWDKENSKIIEREGSFFLKDEELVGAYCIIRRRGWVNPYKWTINLRDYLRTHKNKAGQIVPMGNWGIMPGVMLTKCAIVATIRNVFPEDVGGCYTEDEVGIPSDAIDVTPDTDSPKQPSKQKSEPVKTTIEQNQIAQLCITAAGNSKTAGYNPEDLLKFAMESLVQGKILESTSKREIPKDKFKTVLDYVKKLAENKLKAHLKKESDKKLKEEPAVPEGLPIEDAKHAQPAGKKEDSKMEGDSKVGN